MSEIGTKPFFKIEKNVKFQIFTYIFMDPEKILQSKTLITVFF